MVEAVVDGDGGEVVGKLVFGAERHPLIGCTDNRRYL